MIDKCESWLEDCISGSLGGKGFYSRRTIWAELQSSWTSSLLVAALPCHQYLHNPRCVLVADPCLQLIFELLISSLIVIYWFFYLVVVLLISSPPEPFCNLRHCAGRPLQEFSSGWVFAELKRGWARRTVQVSQLLPRLGCCDRGCCCGCCGCGRDWYLNGAPRSECSQGLYKFILNSDIFLKTWCPHGRNGILFYYSFELLLVLN